MKPVGECVWRASAGLSEPRGETPMPQTTMVGSARLAASYASASSGRKAVAAAFEPSTANCGIQKRLMFGSLPTITSEKPARTTAAVYEANSARAAGVSGVTLEPKG